MTRKKVKLAWIANNTTRRASLKKRRLGLVKKVMELTTLCGIEACLVIYSPDEQEPMVWPSQEEARRLIQKFYQVPEIKRASSSVVAKQGMPRPPFGVGSSSNVVANGLGLPSPPFGNDSSSDVAFDCLGLLRPPFGKDNSSHVVAYALGQPSLLAGERSSLNVASDHLGLPRLPFGEGRSSNVVVDYLGLSRPSFGEGNSSNVVVGHFGLQRPPLSSSSSTSSFDIFRIFNIVIDLLDNNNLGPFSGQDVRLGHYLLGPLGSSYPANEFGRNHFEFFNGESSSCGDTSNSEMEGTN
ncbi:hypothetical protein GOBAR_AA12474 [Gossypium barbadense]|uniref:MADS-box domain-containing protein n=1 Tax=Gossypium barbadense TaxID=3634 RepID=A0A2P5XXU0_GOSBA|nr:hypothetical protein GOBAR_AA12474 [Gossypium barbadense]